MTTGLLKRLPSFSYLFLLLCAGTWLTVSQRNSSLSHECQCLNNQMETLTELTKKWEHLNEKTASADAPVQELGRKWHENHEKRIQEYKEVSLIQNAITQKTYNRQITKLSDIRNRMYQYAQTYSNIANQMNRHAEQINRSR